MTSISGTQDSPACAYFSRTQLQESLHAPDRFSLSFELVPGRGGRSRQIENILALARDLAIDGRFQAVSITENAGGGPALSPEVLGAEILALGLEVIVHVSCKDKNRNQMESLFFAWDRIGLKNLLVISGDYPRKGFRGHPKPVFDVDSVQALDMLSALNAGQKVGRDGILRPGGFQPTSFCAGVAVSPFKHLEAELLMQYGKLARKISAGAVFAITQVGFDPRKFEELLFCLRRRDLQIPVLGNVFVPAPAVARAMFKGAIPGCVIPPTLYERMEKEFAHGDGGHRARLKRAGRLLAVLKGLGFAGAHIGGHGLSMKDIDSLLDEAGRHEKDWQAACAELFCWPETSFYYFRRDPATGMNQKKTTPRSGRRHKMAFLLSRLAHRIFFDKKGPLYPFMLRVCRRLAGSRLEAAFARLEHIAKIISFDCRNCGDCSLAELAFLCPQSGCAKYLLNGPCGGSNMGWCEVYPGRRRCLYVLYYERLQGRGNSAFRRGYLPPRNWALNNSSSWINYFMGADHCGTDSRPIHRVLGKDTEKNFCNSAEKR